MNNCADIKVGYACNNKCIHCVIANQKIAAQKKYNYINRTTKECLQIIQDSKDNGYNDIVITGGEPTIRKDFFEILEFAKSLGMSIYLQTNGWMFMNEEFAKKAAEYIEHFSIAIHGSTPEIHNAITLVKESFDETLLGLKNLVKYTDKITGKIVISKHNSKDLKNILFLLNSIGVKNSNITFPHANGNAAKNFVEVVPYYGEIKDYITECIEYAYSVNHNLKLEAILPCTFDVLYPTELFADFECQFDNVRLHQLNEKETLNWKKIRREIKMKGDICDKCMFNSICEGYWMEYVQVRGFNEFTPITEETVYAFSDKV